MKKNDQGDSPIIPAIGEWGEWGEEVKEPNNVCKPSAPTLDDMVCVHCEKTMTWPFKIDKDFFELSEEVTDVDAGVFIVL